MRYIPQSILAKVKSLLQTPANDADPRINLVLQRTHRYIDQGAMMTPITLWEREQLGPIAVAYRRESHLKAPDYVYLAYIDAGQAHVARQPYIASIEARNEWEYLYTLGPAIDIAIEFDGRWHRTSKDAEVCFDSPARWSLVTFGEPYFFRVLPSGSLVVQQGQGEPFELAAGVSKVAALRGWKNTIRWNHDHGLICAYIRDGTVYYRNYCMQGDDSDPRPAAWEIERDPGLPTPAQDLALFRTNDYRVGFLCESAGEIHWKITDRNWAGMAIPEHTISARGDGVYVRFAKITYHEGYIPNHAITATGKVDVVALLYAMSDNAFIHAENDGPTTVYAHCQHYLTNIDLVDFRIIDSVGTVFNVTAATNGGKDFIFTVENLNFSTPGDLTLHFLGSGNTKGEAGQDVDPFELTFTPTGLEYVEQDPPQVEAIWNE